MPEPPSLPGQPYRPLTEDQRRAYRAVAHLAWGVRSRARALLTEQREVEHARIEREYYVAMCAADEVYDEYVRALD